MGTPRALDVMFIKRRLSVLDQKSELRPMQPCLGREDRRRFMAGGFTDT